MTKVGSPLPSLTTLPQTLANPLRALEQLQNEIGTQSQQKEVGQKENRGAEASAGQAALQLLQQLQQNLFEHADTNSEREKTLGKAGKTSQGQTLLQGDAVPANASPQQGGAQNNAPNPMQQLAQLQQNTQDQAGPPQGALGQLAQLQEANPNAPQSPFEKLGIMQKAVEKALKKQQASPLSKKLGKSAPTQQEGFPTIPGAPTAQSPFPQIPANPSTQPTTQQPSQGIPGASFPSINQLSQPPSKEQSITNARQSAQQAINETGSASDHPYMKRQEGILQGLQAAGLPNRADGVRLLVMDNPQHGDEVVRAAAGKGALAQGADVQLHSLLQKDQPPPNGLMTPQEHQQYQKDMTQVMSLAVGQTVDAKGNTSSANFQDLSLDQIGQIGAKAENTFLNMRRAEVAHARDLIPNDGKPSVVNMSWGMSTAKYADNIAAQALQAPKGSKLHQELTAALGHPPSLEDKNQDGKPDDLVAVRGLIANRIDSAMKSPASQKQSDATRAKLASELQEARKEGILFINSAGNEHAIASEIGRPELSRNYSTGTEGLLTVGATEPYNRASVQPNQKPAWNYTSTLGMSSEGAEVTAPGVMPIADPETMRGVMPGAQGPVEASTGLPQPGTVNGTSFSAPYVAGIAALMIKANPSITPDQIEGILKDPRVTTNDPTTTRDGAGAVDPQKAVQMAADLAR
ncbi:MAG: S8 family serine peptidase [Myxococcales bacterium]|nr:S8 family serine peptidase [Myxococcales bacterium]MCB9644593.1 S8 family serine peptidase [Myxococcales bacterium]